MVAEEVWGRRKELWVFGNFIKGEAYHERFHVVGRG